MDESAEFGIINSILNDSPNGGTPLCRHIREVIASIRALEPSLRAQGQRACVIIATDGESSDGDIAQAMLPLKDLPVWVVLRLCTDDDKVVSYWNAIDEQLELSMDVLDDLFGEAEEVHRHNPWLVYGEPLHRLREFGSLSRELDLLDERLVPLEDLRKLCCSIIGGEVQDFPDPCVDFPEFYSRVSVAVMHQSRIFDVLTKRDRPWIDVAALKACYGRRSLCNRLCNIS